MKLKLIIFIQLIVFLSINLNFTGFDFTVSQFVSAQTKAKLIKANRIEESGVFEAPVEPATAFGRRTIEIQTALTPIAAKFQSSIVEFESLQGRHSLGTVVAERLVIGKRSELGDSFICLIDGEKVSSRLIGFQSDHDLALVELHSTDFDFSKLVPIEFPKAKSSCRVGKLVASMTDNPNSARLGMVSVVSQKFGIQQPKTKDGIDLGAVVSPFRITRLFSPSTDKSASDPASTIPAAQVRASGIEVTRVYPRTISESSGLLVGDLIQSANGQGVSSRAELEFMARKLRVGQTLEFVVIRGGVTKRLSTKISDFVPRILHDRWGGGPFSKKRFGFQQVISHDTVIEPDQCGAPLVDLEGTVVGINIARSMRVSSFAIPISTVYDFVSHVRPYVKIKTRD